jgi:hypothetical protein
VIANKAKSKSRGSKSINGGVGIVADARGLEEVSVAGREKPHPEPSSTGLRAAFAKKAK